MHITSNFHTLIILGNGFDVNLGFKTRYTDFIDSDHFDSLLKNNNQLANYLKEKKELQLWIDVEKELTTFTREHPDHKELLNDFEGLSQSLTQYLKHVRITTKINENSLGFELLEKYAKKGFLIVDFNYTNLSLEVLKKIGVTKMDLDGRMVNIHGTLKNDNIIFGVEDSAGIGNHYFLKKSYPAHYKYFDLEGTLMKAPEIIIFGHSLGETDHPYFKPFFNYLMSHDSDNMDPKTMTLYHYGKEGYNQITDQIHTLANGQMRSLKGKIQLNQFDTEDNYIH